jgi:hypothetical protein
MQNPATRAKRGPCGEGVLCDRRTTLVALFEWHRLVEELLVRLGVQGEPFGISTSEDVVHLADDALADEMRGHARTSVAVNPIRRLRGSGGYEQQHCADHARAREHQHAAKPSTPEAVQEPQPSRRVPVGPREDLATQRRHCIPRRMAAITANARFRRSGSHRSERRDARADAQRCRSPAPGHRRPGIVDVGSRHGRADGLTRDSAGGPASSGMQNPATRAEGASPAASACWLSQHDVLRRQHRLVMESIRVHAQDPARALAREPVRRALDDAGRE